jgi:hypothetical protein
MKPNYSQTRVFCDKIKKRKIKGKYVSYLRFGRLGSMKYFILLLYILSYTTGIGCIALLSLYSLRYRRKTLGYFVIFDLFFTLLLVFDTLDFYLSNFTNYRSKAFGVFILLVTFLTIVCMIYFGGIHISRIVNRIFHQPVLWIGAMSTISVLVLTLILEHNRILSEAKAFHVAGIMISIFSVFELGYYALSSFSAF